MKKSHFKLCHVQDNFHILQVVKLLKNDILHFFQKNGQILENSVIEYQNKTKNTAEEPFASFEN